PATSASLMRGFQRLATIAKRAPAGTFRSPSKWGMRGAGEKGPTVYPAAPAPAREARALRRIDVLDDLQPEPGQPDLLARRAQHAQPAVAQVGQDLAAGTIAAPLGQRAGAGRLRLRLLADARQQRLGLL